MDAGEVGARGAGFGEDFGRKCLPEGSIVFWRGWNCRRGLEERGKKEWTNGKEDLSTVSPALGSFLRGFLRIMQTAAVSSVNCFSAFSSLPPLLDRRQEKGINLDIRYRNEGSSKKRGKM